MNVKGLPFGDALFQRGMQHQAQLFDLGRSAQLSYVAFEQQARVLTEHHEAEIKLVYPLGLRPDGTVIQGEHAFPKETLIAHYRHLAEHELAVIGVYHLVTLTEAFFTDVTRAILFKYPQKLGAKKQISVSVLFEAPTLDAAREISISAFCNDLSYMSPREYAENVKAVFGFSLLEIPVYHKYLEIKATRDIFIHNRGVANAVYQGKAGSHTRAPTGSHLPMSSHYFLQCYESCLVLAEALLKAFHEAWPSEQYEASRATVSGAAGETPPATQPSPPEAQQTTAPARSP